MAREYQVTWSAYALDALAGLVEGVGHAFGNPAWVERKFQDCVLEAIERLELFPDLRLRYVVADRKCAAMTLRVLPVQVFYRQVAATEIAVFACRWAAHDTTGPTKE